MLIQGVKQGFKKALPTNLAPKLVTNYVKPSLYKMHNNPYTVLHNHKMGNAEIMKQNKLNYENKNIKDVYKQYKNNQLLNPKEGLNKKYNYIVENLYKHKLIDAKKHPKELYKQDIGNEEKLNEYYELLKAYDKKIMVNEITVKELKDIFNNLIKNTKQKYKDISTKLLDNLSNNFNSALKQKLIRNKNIAFLFELAEIINNKPRLIQYLKVLNNHFKRVLLHNKAKFKNFIINFKILFRFYKKFYNDKLNSNLYFKKLKLITAPVFAFLLHNAVSLLLLLNLGQAIKNKNKKKELEEKIEQYKSILQDMDLHLLETIKKNEELEEINNELQETNEIYKFMLKNTGGSRSRSKSRSGSSKTNEITYMYDSNSKIFKIFSKLDNLDNYKKNINKEEKEKINQLAKVFFETISNNFEKQMKYYSSIEKNIKKIKKNTTNGILDKLIKSVKSYILKNANFNLSMELIVNGKKSNISAGNLNDYILYLETINTITKNN
jgi:hypothetical protein